jgi:excisionase family DNA binding protein
VSALAPPELLTSPQVAELLGIADRTVRELAEKGELPYVRFGDRGRYRFRREDIERLLEPRRGAA